jgi:TatD DNase family protein
MMDLHCHLDLYENPVEVAQEAVRRQIYVLSVTTTPSAWAGTSALAPEGSRIRTALGLHPQLVGERGGEMPLFEKLFSQTSYIGEIGLDGGPEYASSWDRQVEIFSAALRMCARAGGRVITIHSRRAATPVLDCLSEAGDVGKPILHWFSGTKSEIQRAVALNCWFSVGPAMLRGARGRDLTKLMPRDRVLLETDGPFGRAGDSPLYPWDANTCVPVLADIWQISIDRAETVLSGNLHRLVA